MKCEKPCCVPGVSGGEGLAVCGGRHAMGGQQFALGEFAPGHVGDESADHAR